MRARQCRSAVLILTLLLSSAPLFAQGAPLVNAGVEARVDALLGQMTLAEKIGQLNQFSGGGPTGPGTGRTGYGEMVAAGQIGSIFNVTGAKQTNDLQRIAMTQSRLKIPLIFGLDVIHGYRTTFPVPLALASSWDPSLVENAAAAAAREASAEGIRWTFSPMVDIARDARWGRITEGAGEDPYLGAAMAAAYVRGYQGTRLDDPSSIAACAKHFVGYGAVEGGRDYNTTEIPDRLLRNVYLPPFYAAVRAGSATVMSAFNPLNEVPATANAFTLQQILKREWGFRGFVVSDWTAIKELMAQGIANDGASAARKALLAGVDMDMESGLYLNELTAQVNSGAVPMAAIDDSVRRILRIKFALGLFEHPYVPESDTSSRLDPVHMELARTAAEESIILLKNGDSRPSLPLAGGTHSVALIGPLADDARNMLGSWAGKGNPAYVVTLRVALSDYAAKHNWRLSVEKGVEIIGGSDAGIAAAVDAARHADVVLLAVGENAPDMSGEAASRTRLGLPGLQEHLVEAVAATGKPTVLIVFSGRPLVLTPLADKVSAIVQAWFPGVQAGPALVRLLTGEANFSARSTVSFPRAVGQEPLYYSQLNTGRPASKVDLTHPPTSGDEKYVSRYIDETNSPLFAFGYGLSYSKFEFGPPSVSLSTISARTLNSGGQTLHVSAEIRNTSSRDGVEVVQLYIRLRGTSVARPVRELKGFQRVALGAGESRRVEFTLGREELRFWNIDMKDIVEPAALTVWVAPDSQSGQSAEVQITE